MNTVEVNCESLPVILSSQFPNQEELVDVIINAVNVTLESRSVSDAEISVALVGDRQIHEINQKFLNHDYETDVITFDLRDTDFGPQHLQGEIVISVETAAQQGYELQTSCLSEIVLYAIHGSLHLTGFDDHTPDDRKDMRNAERVLMNQLGFEYKFEDEDGADE